MAKLLETNAVIAHEAIQRLSVSGLAPLDFLKEVAMRVGSVMRYDAGAWLTLDPATRYPAGPSAPPLLHAPQMTLVRTAPRINRPA